MPVRLVFKSDVGGSLLAILAESGTREPGLRVAQSCHSRNIPEGTTLASAPDLCKSTSSALYMYMSTARSTSHWPGDNERRVAFVIRALYDTDGPWGPGALYGAAYW